MENGFFDVIKQILQEDKERAEGLMQKIKLGENITNLRNLDEAVKVLKEGKFIVGFSLDIKDGKLGAAFDNAYRLDKNRFYAYKFIPNMTERPFKMIPSQSSMFPMSASTEFVDDFIKDWIDSLHHGFVLGDGGLLDLEHLPKFQIDKIADKLS